MSGSAGPPGTPAGLHISKVRKGKHQVLAQPGRELGLDGITSRQPVTHLLKMVLILKYLLLLSNFKSHTCSLFNNRKFQKKIENFRKSIAKNHQHEQHPAEITRKISRRLFDNADTKLHSGKHLNVA